MADPHRVLRRRRGPVQLALGVVLVVLVLVVEALILQAYANVNRTTAIFGEQSYLNSSLVNAPARGAAPRERDRGPADHR